MPPPAPTGLERIAPALRDTVVALDALTPHPDNARNGDVDAIAQSLLHHGQYAPVLAQTSTGRVIKGNHVYAAALSLGWAHIAATYLDVDDTEALRVLLDDNRASDLGRYDAPQLAGLLQDLDATDSGLEGTLFTDGDLTRLLARIEADEQRALDPDHQEPGEEPTAQLADLTYLLRLDTPEQMTAWRHFLTWLERTHPGETTGQRLHAHLRDVDDRAAARSPGPGDPGFLRHGTGLHTGGAHR